MSGLIHTALPLAVLTAGCVLARWVYHRLGGPR